MGEPKVAGIQNSKPCIYEYEDYRIFLRDLFDFTKRQPEGFSFRRFSEAAGFRAPNMLKLVIEGNRNLTLSSIRRTAKAFELDHEESTYFKNLVFLCQSTSSLDRAKFARELLRSKKARELYPLKEAELRYYGRWYYVPLRELVNVPDFKEDGRWIAENLRSKLTPTQAVEALEELIAIGALTRNADGKLIQAQPQVTTGNEIRSGAVAEFHGQMLQRAVEAIDDVQRQEREISSSTLVLTERQFAKLKELIQEFRRSLLAEEDLSEAGAKRVYQFGCQLFPLSEKPESLSPVEKSATRRSKLEDDQ